MGEGRREEEKKGLVWRPLVGLPWPVRFSAHRVDGRSGCLGQRFQKVWVLRTEVPEWAPELLGPGVSITVE